MKKENFIELNHEEETEKVIYQVQPFFVLNSREHS